MKDALCKAFCEALTVQEVPVGLAIGTPFWRGADRLGFYIVYQDKARTHARFEDDTQTITLIEAAGVDLFSGPRETLFLAMMDEAGVSFNEDEGVLHTPYMPVTELPRLAFSFVAFLIKMQDFSLMTRERVEETFKADVIQAVQKRFEDRAAVKINAPPLPDYPDYLSDALILPSLHPPLALYIGRSETKALEALLLSTKAESVHQPCNVMVVIPNLLTRVKGRTKKRMAQAFPVVPFIGHEVSVLDQMEQITLGEPMVMQ